MTWKKLAYLREKKNYDNNPPYYWYSWEFKYRLDYKGYSKLITINAYIQKDRTERWSDHYEEKLDIFKKTEIIIKKESKELLSKTLSEGYFDY